MKVVLQRVSESSVRVNGQIVGAIERGWLALLGVERGDSHAEAKWLAEKCVGLRGFTDSEGKMNLSVADVQGAILVVSQFTLLGDCNKGRRPSFIGAELPETAKILYETFCDQIANLGIPVQRGIFQADMKVALVNDGPVTFLLERSPQSP